MDVVVIGGGLAGLSAAHTALQAGLSVTMIERNAFMGLFKLFHFYFIYMVIQVEILPKLLLV